MAPVEPRAEGRRLPYESLPGALTEWVTAAIGDVAVVRRHRGGMSPGAAVTLRSPAGDSFFVKAVGRSLNEQTLELFRRELALLRAMPPAPYRPPLLAAYDDGDWVALILNNVDGAYPDMTSERDVDAVLTTVLSQTSELTPVPPGAQVPAIGETVARWQLRWQNILANPAVYLPQWAADTAEALAVCVGRLATQVAPTTLCHFDIRNDNLLITQRGDAVIFDWGMARAGPAWVDLAMLAVQLPTAAGGDGLLREHLPASDSRTATDFLIAFAGAQSWNARQPAPPSLPAMPTYCAEDARRLWDLARYRLDSQ